MPQKKKLSPTYCASTYLHIYLQAYACALQAETVKTMEARRDVFQAIADPTRRGIIGMIAKGPMTLNTIAGNFDVSRQAVSLHVGILIECGLVKVHQRGRERYCEARLDALDEVTDWVDKYRKFWNAKFDALEKFLDNEEQELKAKKNKRSKTGRK